MRYKIPNVLVQPAIHLNLILNSLITATFQLVINLY